MAKLSGAANAAVFGTDRMRINRILSTDRLRPRDKRVAVFNYILHQEVLGGTLFLVTPDETPYIRIGLLREIVSLPKHGRGGDVLFAYLYQRYGLHERDDTTKYLYDCLRSHALLQGELVEMRRFSAYDKKTQTLYLSAYNGEVYEIDGNVVGRSANGDNVYFADDDGGKSCAPNVGSHGSLIETLTNLSFEERTLGGISSEHQRRALITWIFALAFPDLMPTKPVLLVEGAPGAGKSSAVQLIQLALMGAKKSMILQRNKEDDFGVILLRSPIAVFDNTDSYIEWVPDAICAYATSGMWTKRKLFSDDAESIIRPHSFIAVASKNPASFRREDVADRCIILRLQPREEGTFISQEKLESELLDRRDEIFGEYLYYCNKIVDLIRRGALNTQRTGVFRMADFQSFAYVVGEAFDWPEEEVTAMIEGLKMERNAFISEDDPLCTLLQQWLCQRPMGRWNVGRMVTAQELFQDLNALAESQRITFYKSSRALAQKLRSPHLQADFIIESITHPTQRNVHAYQIWMRTTTGKPPALDAPILTLVDDAASDDTTSDNNEKATS